MKETEAIVTYLKSWGKNFTFYSNQSREGVEKIMADRAIKEVFFLGHGDSHTFELSNKYDLHYCDFDDPKYAKDLVHQVHCGSAYGKSLIEYVVPIENREKCFIKRDTIDDQFIINYFKERTKNVSR